LILTGCGGSGDSNSPNLPGHTYSVRAETAITTGSLSKDEFFERATRMCKNRQTLVLNRFRDFRDERPGVKPSNLIADAAQSYLLPGIQFVFDDLRLMGAPEGDEEQVEEMVGAFQFAVESGQRRRISSAAQFGGLFRVFNELAHLYGLDQCMVNKAHYAPVWAASH
jgi:hypothetical protein